MKSLAAITVAASGILLSAQAPGFSPAIETALDGLAKGAYLAASNTLATAAFAPDGQVRDHAAFQLWSQFSPFLTNELDPAIVLRGVSASAADPRWATRLSAAIPRDAIDEIVTRAHTTNVVILNEAHSSPRDRAFALQVARALRPLGYKTLAIEALDNNQPQTGTSRVDQLKRDGFVRFGTGVYTRDPVFARFLREALAIGYEPVAYEQTRAQSRPTDGIAEREQAQAENLMQRIFSTRPREKVLIYVGHEHVVENPLASSSGESTEWMAARLKRMAGIDPLTIDQTGITDVSARARSAYAAAASRIRRRPVTFFEDGTPLVLGRYAGGVDLQVIHPHRSYQSGRPTWLVALGGRWLPVPRQLPTADGRQLVQAFAADAPTDAVPLDQVLLHGSAHPMLFVPAGPVRFAIQQ